MLQYIATEKWVFQDKQVGCGSSIEENEVAQCRSWDLHLAGVWEFTGGGKLGGIKWAWTMEVT